MQKLTKKLIPATLALTSSLAGCVYNQPGSRKDSATVEEAMAVLITDQPQFIVFLPYGYKSLRNEEAKLMKLAGINNGSITVKMDKSGKYVFEGTYDPRKDGGFQSALEVMRDADANGDFVISPREIKDLEREMYKQYSK